MGETTSSPNKEDMISPAVIFVCLLGFSASAKLPDSVKKCSRKDKNLHECVTKAAQDSLGLWVKGIPSVGFLPIDPLRITMLDINQGDGPVAIDLKFRNLDIYNLKTMVFQNISVDLENRKIGIDTTLQEPLKLESDYEIKGKVLILPIQGKGRVHFRLDGLVLRFVATGEEVNKNGKVYLKLDKDDLHIETSRLHMKFDGLFNNDKALGDNMNKFLNENWKEIFTELRSALEESFGAAFREVIQRLFIKVPINDLFLE